MTNKPSIPEVAGRIRQWYAKPGNACGGLFHIILEDGNPERQWAEKALIAARESGESDAIALAELLVAMSPTQRRKLSMMRWDGPTGDNTQV